MDCAFIFPYKCRHIHVERNGSHQPGGLLAAGKTLSDDLTLTVPAPAGLGTFVPPLPDSYQPPMSPVAKTKQEELASSDANGEFDLQFALTSDFASDLITTLGTRQNAKVGLDRFDQGEPPILKGTVAAYFESDRDGRSSVSLDGRTGRSSYYNTDYQPSLEIGETRTWQLVVYASKPKAKMRLSWEDAIEQVPDDVMLTLEHGSLGKSGLQDMRQVQSVELDTQQFITKETFEIRAERFEMVPPKNLSIVAGEKEVTIKWAANDNPFIENYTVKRTTPDVTGTIETIVLPMVHEFIDKFGCLTLGEPERGGCPLCGPVHRTDAPSAMNEEPPAFMRGEFQSSGLIRYKGIFLEDNI